MQLSVLTTTYLLHCYNQEHPTEDCGRRRYQAAESYSHLGGGRWIRPGVLWECHQIQEKEDFQDHHLRVHTGKSYFDVPGYVHLGYLYKCIQVSGGENYPYLYNLPNLCKTRYWGQIPSPSRGGSRGVPGDQGAGPSTNLFQKLN